jgi:3-demethylubiquinone-9 3-methyltransferase
MKKMDRCPDRLKSSFPIDRLALFTSSRSRGKLPTSPKNTICLWFDKNAVEAANFYAATFRDSKVTAVHKAPSDYPEWLRGHDTDEEDRLRRCPGSVPTLLPVSINRMSYHRRPLPNVEHRAPVMIVATFLSDALPIFAEGGTASNHAVSGDPVRMAEGRLPQKASFNEG